MLSLVPKVRSKSARQMLAVSGIIAVTLVTFFAGRWTAFLSPTPGGAAPDALPDPLRTPAARYDWLRLPPAEFPIPAYAKFLRNVTIVLDPGHVGQTDKGGDWKRGPTGLREAEANLRVALALREFLSTAGARVVLTREQDRELGLKDAEDLQERAEIANRADADLFISLHHNASPDPDRNDANYSTIYYHMSPDYSPASLSAGRYLLTGLNDALRLEQQQPCALVADAAADTPSGVKNGHRGYAVLRYSRVPALLVESSFHTNPWEEQRLRDGVYNRREAYGLFLGLARWAQAGLPRVGYAPGHDGRLRAGETISLTLDDGLSGRGGMAAGQVKILVASLSARLGSRDVRIDPELSAGRARVTIPADIVPGRHVLTVDFENIFGQHVLHPNFDIEIAAAAAPPRASEPTQPPAPPQAGAAGPPKKPARTAPPPAKRKTKRN